jgi:hypothetical protein
MKNINLSNQNIANQRMSVSMIRYGLGLLLL